MGGTRTVLLKRGGRRESDPINERIVDEHPLALGWANKVSIVSPEMNAGAVRVESSGKICLWIDACCNVQLVPNQNGTVLVESPVEPDCSRVRTAFRGGSFVERRRPSSLALPISADVKRRPKSGCPTRTERIRTGPPR